MLTSRRRSAGFNLIEVMIAVTVLALILGLGFPSVAEWLRNTQLRSLSESLQTGLQKARAEAIKRNRPVTFWLVSPAVGIPDASCALSSASGSWVVSLDDPSGKCDVAASDTTAPRTIERFGNTSSNITVAATGSGGVAANSVTFNGFGQPLAGTTPITTINLDHQQSGARQLTVQISTGGGVRLCDRAFTAGSSDPRACL
ncbi:MAG: prepilin-type N-terminal cleavage/methylation domain-containing protein [Comamonadaceae bacterium]|nr:MAG: prepilin-type N-terminal cleavage/methylation domain-containing protein [Comamonadaceae bacterium]